MDQRFLSIINSSNRSVLVWSLPDLKLVATQKISGAGIYFYNFITIIDVFANSSAPISNFPLESEFLYSPKRKNLGVQRFSQKEANVRDWDDAFSGFRSTNLNFDLQGRLYCN